MVSAGGDHTAIDATSSLDASLVLSGSSDVFWVGRFGDSIRIADAQLSRQGADGGVFVAKVNGEGHLASLRNLPEPRGDAAAGTRAWPAVIVGMGPMDRVAGELRGTSRGALRIGCVAEGRQIGIDSTMPFIVQDLVTARVDPSVLGKTPGPHDEAIHAREPAALGGELVDGDNLQGAADVGGLGGELVGGQRVGRVVGGGGEALERRLERERVGLRRERERRLLAEVDEAVDVAGAQAAVATALRPVIASSWLSLTGKSETWPVPGLPTTNVWKLMTFVFSTPAFRSFDVNEKPACIGWNDGLDSACASGSFWYCAGAKKSDSGFTRPAAARSSPSITTLFSSTVTASFFARSRPANFEIASLNGSTFCSNFAVPSGSTREALLASVSRSDTAWYPFGGISAVQFPGAAIALCSPGTSAEPAQTSTAGSSGFFSPPSVRSKPTHASHHRIETHTSPVQVPWRRSPDVPVEVHPEPRPVEVHVHPALQRRVERERREHEDRVERQPALQRRSRRRRRHVQRRADLRRVRRDRHVPAQRRGRVPFDPEIDRQPPQLREPRRRREVRVEPAHRDHHVRVRAPVDPRRHVAR